MTQRIFIFTMPTCFSSIAMSHCSLIFTMHPCFNIATINDCVLIDTLTQKTESMFHLVSFHAPYFENQWTKSK
jgi:hypothetical protein